MLRVLSLSLAVVLAGCPPKPAGTMPQPAPTGAGCPTAAGVYIASYATQDASKGRSGWVIPLHAMKIDPGANVADYQPLDAAAASVSGVPAAPAGTLWLMTDGAAPCHARLGGYYAAKVPGPPASLSYGIELDGCPAPADPQNGTGLVLVSEQAPAGCRFDAPRSVAARLGEMDAQQHWHRPAKATPFPPALAAIVPAHACTAPGCEPLWAVGEIDVGGRAVAWSAAFNWLEVGDPATPCEWKAERWSGFFVASPTGMPVKVVEGQDHPLVLAAALLDPGGAKVLIAEGPGEYATYDLAAGRTTVGHVVTWMLAPGEAWDQVDHLGPVCAAPAVQPAPLPKDAKPVSPYR